LDHKRDADLLANVKQVTKEIRMDRMKSRGKTTIPKLKAKAAKLDSLLERFKGQLIARKKGARR
jgi:hypothetical protein